MGCVLGGILGASAALLMPKKFINGINGVQRSSMGVHRNGTHAHRNGHKGHVIHDAAKNFTVKKPKTKKVIKH